MEIGEHKARSPQHEQRDLHAARPQLRELSLFSGMGGGLLGSKLLGWRTVGYVENDKYRQKVIQARIRDGILDDAPIFADIKEFAASEGDARAYAGHVDIVTAGFPCQPHSMAGRRQGGADSRNLWPATLDVICHVRPQYIFLENVRGLLSTGYFQEILQGLAQSGYDAHWRIVSAAEIGAPHKRERIWIFAWQHGQVGGDIHVYRQPDWEQSICSNAFGSLLPSPVVPNGGRQHNLDNIRLEGNTLYRQDGSKAQMDLETYVRLWATPQARDYRSGEAHRWENPERSRNLNDQATWASLAHGDAHGHQPWANRQGGVGLNQQVGGKLNPDWVEMLMGIPVGWTKLEQLDIAEFERWQDGFGANNTGLLPVRQQGDIRYGREAWANGSWEEGIDRIVAGHPGRVDRLKALGDGQVPLCMAVAFCLLSGNEDTLMKLLDNNTYKEEPHMNEIVIAQSAQLSYEIGETTEVSWTAPADLDFDRYQQIGQTFQQIRHSLAYWVGDWLNEGERRFSDIYMQAVDDTGKAVETLLKWKAVSFRVPKEIRRADLTWTHHFYVAYVIEEHRAPLLDLAANVGLSSRDLKEVVKLSDERRQAILEAVENHLEEEGPMDHDTFMRLLNRFKLDSLDDEEQDGDEADLMDDENEEDDDESGDESDDDMDYEDIFDFWENQGVALKHCGRNQATWEGMTVYAAVNQQGKAILVWEPNDE